VREVSVLLIQGSASNPYYFLNSIRNQVPAKAKAKINKKITTDPGANENKKNIKYLTPPPLIKVHPPCLFHARIEVHP